jgi:beta-xylosidase
MMVIKDETREPAEKNLKLAYADDLEGPYSEASEKITGDYWAEGPTVIKNNGAWYVYFDRYMDNHFGVIKSKDLKNWTDVSDQLQFPEGIRHGTILKISNKELNKLKAL